MVKQHQLVQQELKKEIEGIHGLQVGFFGPLTRSLPIQF